MPNDDTNHELTVLDALKATCEQVRRHNANPEVARIALQWELKIASSMERLTGGTGREAVKAA